MRHTLYILYILALVLPTGCTGKYNGSLAGKGEGRGTLSQSADTVHTRQVAMSIYAYQPARALQIIDSALIVGNVGEVQAQQCRARIYSFTQMYDQMDSLLGGSKDVRLDSAQAIAERLLDNDSIKADLKRLRDVLEILAYTDRMKCDTLGWIQWSSKLVDLCRQMGPEAEADALRTEAEIAAALCALGQEKEAMAKLDSVISSLSGAFRFSELDALIVALKRKIVFLGSRDRYAETLPLSRQIIERLDDYEAHPDKYHDGSHREPNTDQKRADYIRFYRSQAQSYQTAALAALGEHGNMLTAFRQIEDGVREATAREHIARYNALQQKIEAEHQLANAERANLIAAGIGILALLAIAFAVILFHKNRVIRRKNRILAQQITDAVDYKELYYNSLTPNRPTPSRPTPSRPTPQPLPIGRGWGVGLLMNGLTSSCSSTSMASLCGRSCSLTPSSSARRLWTASSCRRSVSVLCSPKAATTPRCPTTSSSSAWSMPPSNWSNSLRGASRRLLRNVASAATNTSVTASASISV